MVPLVAVVPCEPRWRPRACPGRAGRRRSRLAPPPNGYRGRGLGRSVRAAWPRRAGAAARLRLASDPGGSGRGDAAAWRGRPRQAARRSRSRAASTRTGGLRPAAFVAAASSARRARPSRVCRKRRGALQKGGGRRKSPSGARTLGRLLELVRDVVVGPGGGMSAMPDAAIGIELGDRWRLRAPDARLGAPRSAPRGRSPSAGASGETRLAGRALVAHLPPREPARRSGFRARPPPGRAARAHPSGRPQPRAASRCVADGQLLHALVGSSLQCGLAAIRRRGAQTRRRAPRATIRAGARAGQGDCRASRQVFGRARARPGAR